MYSRRTYDTSFRIPAHYSGTAFRQDRKAPERDAVGRLSALPDSPPDPEEKQEMTVRKRVPPPKSAEHREENRDKIRHKSDAEEGSVQEKNRFFGREDSDDIMIGALLLSLLDGKRENGEDIALIVLVLLLIL